MYMLQRLLPLFLATPAIVAVTPSTDIPPYLNLTAISAADGRSTLECWQLTAGFAAPNIPGIIGGATASLGPAGSLNFTILPGNFDGGIHHAPLVQYVAFVSGLAHIIIPETKEEAFVRGGKDGLIIATDVAAVSKIGHETKYPSKEQTISIAIPTRDGQIPDHRVLHHGPCSKKELP